MTLVRQKNNRILNILLIALIGFVVLASCGKQESSGGNGGGGVPRGWDTKALVR